MASPAGSKLATAFIEVGANFGDFGKALEQGVGNAITSTGAALGAAMEGFGKELFKRFTIPFAIAAAANIAQWQGLERAIGETLTLFGTAPALVDETFDAMSAGITRVSEEVGGLERDIADGLYQTISAGVPRGDAFEFLNVAQLAATADKTADLTTAVDGITTAINAFGLEFSDAGTVADQFFATVARGKTTFGELSQALGRVAPLAANAGTSLQETLAIVGQLTTSGLQTSEAVSFLRAAITGLLRPTDELNDIFQRVGFETAEAAIPVIGLQAAFEKVVSAAGGSTSKLQELIGTSEGVSAILGVTGENAEKFASVLNSVENSAGSAQNAFDIIDGTISRSFGKLTEAFDRMGNLFGSFGAQFAQPVVDMFTDIINSVTSNFQKMTPVVSNFADTFTHVLKAFDNPVFRQMAAAIATVVVGFGAMLGLIGAILFPLGKLVGLFFKLSAVKVILKALSGQLVDLRFNMRLWGKSIQLAGAKMAAAATSTSALGRIIQALGVTMQTTLGSIAAVTVVILAVAAAVAGAVILWSRWKDSMEAAFDAEQTFTLGVERLAVAVGATTHAMELGKDSTEDYVSSLDEFLLTNGDLVGKLQEVQLTLGNLAAKRFLISIAADLQLKGASADEALRAVKLLLEGSGLAIPITFDEVESANNFDALLGSFSDQITTWNRDVGTEVDKIGNVLNAQIENTVAQITDGFVAASKAGKTIEFFQQLNEDAAGIENVFVANELIKQLALSIEEASGRDLRLSTSDISSSHDPVAELIRQLTLVNAITPEVAEQLNALGDVEIEPHIPKDLTGGLASDIETFGIAFVERMPGIIELTDTQLSNLTELKNGIDGILDAGTQYITDHFNEMNTQITNQMPLLGIYEGAVDQTFSAWEKGSKLFVEDLGRVDDARAKLIAKVGDGSELVDAFDAAPISEQVWLARLGPKNFEKALEQLLAQQDAVENSVATRMEQDQGEIMAGVQNAMNEAYAELLAEAQANGDGVATLWQINFDRKSAGWVTTAQSVMDEIARITGQPIDGPVIGPIQFTGGSSYGPDGGTQGGGGGGDVNLNIFNPNTTNLTGDTQRAVGIVKTSQLLRT
jgi:TP901 family phage tail tape measure protein